LALVTGYAHAKGQSLAGSWQLTESKNCVEQLLEESDTEAELSKDFGSSSHSVARIMTFTEKGKGEESIVSKGKKKKEEKTEFRYKMQDNQLLLMDKKSGIITERFVIEEFNETTLRIHRANRDCEVQVFTRIK
jgi:hypothetical protein